MTSVSLTLAICSNRLALLAETVPIVCALAGPDDQILVIVDTDAPVNPELLAAMQCDARVSVLKNGVNRGHSYSRNRVLKECRTRYAVFLDDDIRPDEAALQAVRTAFAGGDRDIVGTRITADLQGVRPPWFFTTGQLHYVGAHDPGRPASIWGGFFAVDVTKAQFLGLEFDERLGRTAGSLCSAEDTTFVRALISGGGRAEVLGEVAVRHLIPVRRLTMPYLVRRAYWQGRSEQRRRDWRRGLRKELQRNWRGDGDLARRTVLTALYGASTFAGICVEAASPARATL